MPKSKRGVMDLEERQRYQLEHFLERVQERYPAAAVWITPQSYERMCLAVQRAAAPIDGGTFSSVSGLEEEHEEPVVTFCVRDGTLLIFAVEYRATRFLCVFDRSLGKAGLISTVLPPEHEHRLVQRQRPK